MKNFILFILILFGLGLHFEADAQRKTYVGVKGGYNLSTAYFFHSLNGVTIDTGLEGGFQGGIIAMNFMRNHVGLQAELNYSQKGWRQKNAGGRQDSVTQLSYLELPLLVNIYTGKNKLHFFANGGCFVEYLLKAKYNFPSTDGLINTVDESRDKKLGYGFRGGAGMFYDFDFGTLLFEGSFSYSLSDMLEPGSLETGIPNTSKNIVVGFSVAYLFSFGTL